MVTVLIYLMVRGHVSQRRVNDPRRITICRLLVSILMISSTVIGNRRRLPLTTTGERCEDCTIVLIAYNRPKYMSRVLKSLQDCIGIHRYDVHIFVEPENDEVISISRKFNAARSWVHVNPSRLGCHANKKQSVAFGFNISEFVIVVEDDTLLAPDALLFFEYAKIAYRQDKSVFSISAFGDSCGRPGERVPKDRAYEYAIARRKHYTPWVWGTWRDRWEEDIRDRWDGWDVQMNFFTPPYREIATGIASPDFSRFHAGLRGERHEIFPVLSRSLNIGSVGGMHESSGQSNALYDWAGAEDRAGQWQKRGGFVELSKPSGLVRACGEIRFREDTRREMCSAAY